jgi:hypothetical protein
LADLEDDETAISEISIAPDGRIYVFGASYAVLHIVEGLASGDSELRRRVDYIQALERHVLHEAAGPEFSGDETTKSAKRCADKENL